MREKLRSVGYGFVETISSYYVTFHWKDKNGNTQKNIFITQFY